MYKDANECLMAGVSPAAMQECLRTAREFAPEKVKNAREFEAEFFEEWFDGETNPGFGLSFAEFYRVRHGELTVWTGFGKHGKTKLLLQSIVELMAQGERACVASMEVKVRKTLKDISRQAWGGLIWDHRQEPRNPARSLDEEEKEARENGWRCLEWLGERLWLYHHVGIVQWRALLDDFTYVLRRYGVRQFVIDSLMRVGIMEDDYAGQSEFVKVLASWAQDNNCHVHLVAHRKKNEKGERQGGEGDKSGVAGAQKITDNAHNIVEVWRDVEKGQKWSELKEKSRVGLLTSAEYVAEEQKLKMRPDGKFILRGQRDGEVQEGSRALWYMWLAYQFTDRPPADSRHGPRRFVVGME